MIRFYIKHNRQAGKITEVVCPRCRTVMTLYGFAALRGSYCTICDACEEIIPPVTLMLENASMRVDWHNYRLEASI